MTMNYIIVHSNKFLDSSKPETVLNLPPMSKQQADTIVVTLNSVFTPNSNSYYKAVPETYSKEV